MKKRTNGEGSISKYKNGYRASIRLGKNPSTGKYERKEFYGKTKKEALEKLEKFKKEYSLYTFKNITFSEYYNNYIEDIAKHTLKDNTIYNYTKFIKEVSNSALGKMRISDIKTIHCQDFINTIEKNHTLSVAKQCSEKLSVVFNLAEKQEIIIKNPMKNVFIKSIETEPNNNVLTLEEQNNFIKYLLESNHKYKTMYIFALLTGVRRGEIRGITWSDIDLDKETVFINKNVQENYNSDGVWGRKVITPKTKSSIRTIPLPKFLISLLKEHKKEQYKRILGNKKYINNDIVFSNKDGGYIYPSTIARNVKRVFKEIGIERDLTFHALRHSYTTRLFELGVAAKTISELLGHSNTNTTLSIYTHISDDIKKDAVLKLDTLYDKNVVNS